ncbi:MAG TPA: rhodanese-like domain-containing protein [Candidatus Baltobacteraceae bacterium]|nr:rhodanese-like domain-containing protein [Candidatus Baltobacteraceae bacterium]
MATVDEVKRAAGSAAKIIDVRKKPDEMQIPGSVRYSGEEIERSEHLPFEKDEHVVLYCGSGNSCSRIAQTLREKGYANAEALDGGYAAWKDAGLPLEPIGEMRTLSD